MLNVPPPPPRRAIRVDKNGRTRLPDRCSIEWCTNEVQSVNRPVHGDLPMCKTHAVMIWQQVQDDRYDEVIVRTSVELAQIREAKRAKYQAERDAELERWRQDEAERVRQARRAIESRKAPGHIYFVEVNGLIKVGWSSNLRERLRAYGPEVKVLCHYEAKRVEETGLHQTLRPFLAHGREWYQDCPFIREMVDANIKAHGRPYLSASWSSPDTNWDTLIPKSGKRAGMHRSSR